MSEASSIFQASNLLPERLAEYPREKIVAGSLAPGERVLEQEVARECNVSRAPVREGLRILESEGLITLSPHRGARVTEVSGEEAGYLYPLRGVLEALAARSAARRIAAEGRAAIGEPLEQIEAALSEMDAATAANDIGRYYSSGAAFHDALVAAAGNPLLTRHYTILKSSARRYQAVMSRIPTSYRASQKEHREIMDAVLAGDEEQAWRLSETHVRRLEADFSARKGEGVA
jgi:DNA-binding GntR family transcriptional regulator